MPRKLTDAFNRVFGDKKRILAVMAHPDDVEIVCGGTIARLIDSKKRVRLVVTTDGAKGTGMEKMNLPEFRKRRIKDQIKAGMALGIPKKELFNLKIGDGEIENTVENIGKVAFHIREFKPDIIITHNPQDLMIKFSGNSGWINHRDHLITGLVTCFAAYPYARDHAFFPEQIKRGLKGHAVKEILFADFYNRKDAVAFDIGNYLEEKRKALSIHFLPEGADEYVNENKISGGYYEILGHYKIY